MKRALFILGVFAILFASQVQSAKAFIDPRFLPPLPGIGGTGGSETGTGIGGTGGSETGTGIQLP